MPGQPRKNVIIGGGTDGMGRAPLAHADHPDLPFLRADLSRTAGRRPTGWSTPSPCTP
ncbi:hypothetical protein [Streptomyces sp. SBT349]|uniref:hypothetical protein n=1 Tax=Streptomyces sp. SBT349 TaxID=1580539 RepID=UPI000A569041|nr:hypothetical protein [Streptomyces sp. SBT349]